MEFHSHSVCRPLSKTGCHGRSVCLPGSFKFTKRGAFTRCSPNHRNYFYFGDKRLGFSVYSYHTTNMDVFQPDRDATVVPATSSQPPADIASSSNMGSTQLEMAVHNAPQVDHNQSPMITRAESTRNYQRRFRVVAEALIELIPSSYHTSNRVHVQYRAIENAVGYLRYFFSKLPASTHADTVKIS